MRKNSSIHYATAVTQYERVTGGQSWLHPENALAINGNTGCTISNVLYTDQEIYPFGPDYLWKFRSSSSSIMPSFRQDENDHHRWPNSLKFSGFTIDDVGITNDCVVTNLHVYLEYTDNTIQLNRQTMLVNKPNGGNWLISVYKDINKLHSRKRFDSISTILGEVYWEKIPCFKDQNWATNTFGNDIVANAVAQGQREVSMDLDYYDNPQNYASYWDYRRQYIESTNDILPLTIGEINNPNFFIEVWYSKFRNYSGTITLKSVGLSVEYIKPYKKNITIWPLTKGSVSSPISVFRPDRNSLNWISSEEAMSYDTQDLQSDSYTYIDLYSKRNFKNIDKPFDNCDSDILLCRLPPIEDMDDSQESISDIILNYRINDLHENIYNWPGVNLKVMNYVSVNWNYYLFNGYLLDRYYGRGYGLPIWSHKMQLFDPGVKRDYNLTGQPWLKLTQGFNSFQREYCGRENWNRNWYTKHYPIRRNDLNYTLETINSSYYPGLTYDPLWIEKAFKQGNMFLGISLTSEFYENTWYKQIQTYLGHIVWKLKIKGLGMRVKYNGVGAPMITGPSGPIPQVNSSLLYRYTP